MSPDRVLASPPTPPDRVLSSLRGQHVVKSLLKSLATRSVFFECALSTMSETNLEICLTPHAPKFNVEPAFAPPVFSEGPRASSTLNLGGRGGGSKTKARKSELSFARGGSTERNFFSFGFQRTPGRRPTVSEKRALQRRAFLCQVQQHGLFPACSEVPTLLPMCLSLSPTPAQALKLPAHCLGTCQPSINVYLGVRNKKTLCAKVILIPRKTFARCTLA